ncbi:MAG: NADH-quinone oxidoreductase subunit N [Candidatus Bathyarchaeia archaeon]
MEDLFNITMYIVGQMLALTTDDSYGQFVVLAPEVFFGLCLCGLWLLASGGCPPVRFNKYVLDTIALVGAALLLTCLWLYIGGSLSLVTFDGLLVVNLYTQAFKLIALLGILPWILFYTQDYDQKPVQTQLLTLSRVFFMMTLVSSNSLLTAYLNIEGLSIMLYSMAGMARTHGASESGLKYYGAGATISAILLFGAALTFHGAGSFQFVDIANVIWNDTTNLSLIVGLRLFILALLMKLAAVPGHVWTPDVYEGVPTIVTAFFATISKLMVFAFAVRPIFACLSVTFGDMSTLDAILLSLISGLSILLGCLGALGQISFKRFIAYASINQIGFLLIGLSVNTIAGLTRSLHYLLVYMVAGVALFGSIMTIERYGLKARRFTDLMIAYQKGAVGPVILAFVAVLSMAGLPPFAGFFGKYALWAALIDTMMGSSTATLRVTFSALLGVSVATSLFSMYYYLRVLKVAVFDQAGTVSHTELAFPVPIYGLMFGVLLTVWALPLSWLSDSTLTYAVVMGVMLY